MGVGVDGEAAAKSEECAEQAATAALADCMHLMLSQANVTITAASDTEVCGTFLWQPPAGIDKRRSPMERVARRSRSGPSRIPLRLAI